MSDAAIVVDQIGKAYRRKGVQSGVTLLGHLTGQGNEQPNERSRDQFWALKDISFTANRGEVLGIMGRNGAGKSTLLRILAQITRPTVGNATLYGRVASLLEVGTGFNKELTGRENIFLNGAILGGSREYLRRKFDEIVDFSGVEAFLDTPIKHYSTGMSVRLGFSIALAMQPDVLLVDEVLAVGDAEFQRKSLERVLGMVARGCSILFVSHDVAAIQRYCHRALLLHHGRTVKLAETSEIIQDYLPQVTDIAPAGEWLTFDHPQPERPRVARFDQMRFFGGEQNGRPVVQSQTSFRAEVQVSASQPVSPGSFSFSIFDISGLRLINARTQQPLMLPAGESIVELVVENLPLNPGIYTIALWMGDASGQAIDQIDLAAYIRVEGQESDQQSGNQLYDGRVAVAYAINLQDRRGVAA